MEAHSHSLSQRSLARVTSGGGVSVEMSTKASVQGVACQNSSSIRPSITGLLFVARATYDRGYEALNEQSGEASMEAVNKTIAAM
jgi:hypothetical protein